MGIKSTISEREFLEMQPPSRSMYKKHENGEYVLDLLDGFIDKEDPAKLKSALDAERLRREELGKELYLMKSKFEGIDAEKAKKDAEEAATAKKALEESLAQSKDMGALIKEFDSRIAKQNEEFQLQLQKRDADTKAAREAAGNAIRKVSSESLATEIFGNLGEKFAPILSQRLQIDEGNQIFAVSPTGDKISVSDFRKEILADKAYAAIINVTKGSGVGDTQIQGTPVDVGDKKFSDLSSDEKRDLIKANPAKYTELRNSSPPVKLTAGTKM